MVGILIGLTVGRLMGLERGTGMRTFALSAGCQNFGFTAAPVVEILWGSGALAMLFVHNIGVETAMWSVGVMMMSGERGISWRKLVNGPIVAVVIGLVLVALGLDDAGDGRDSQGDVDDRRGGVSVGDPDHRLHDHGSGGDGETELEGHGGRLAGAAGAGAAGDSMRGEIPAAGHGTETGAGGAGGDAGGTVGDFDFADVCRTAGGGGAGGDRDDGAELPHAAVDHHVGQRVDRLETDVAMSGRVGIRIGGMKAIGARQFFPASDPECLVEFEAAMPVPGEMDLLVRVRAVSVNPVDTKVRKLLGDTVQDPPRVLGFDAAGIVESVGSEVTGFSPGDEVFYAGDVTRAGQQCGISGGGLAVGGEEAGDMDI